MPGTPTNNKDHNNEEDDNDGEEDEGNAVGNKNTGAEDENEQGKDDDNMSAETAVAKEIRELLTQPRTGDCCSTSNRSDATHVSRTLLFQSNDEDNQSPGTISQFSDYHEIDPRDVETNRIKSSYIDCLYNSSNLIITNPNSATTAFRKKGPLGLVQLFIPPNFINSYMLNATQELLDEKEITRGRKITSTVDKLRCVLGLDIAMSLCNSNTMKELWSKKMFLGSSSFSECMSRDKFITICGSLRIHSKSGSKDPYNPLWTCQPLLSILLKNAATIAYPVGVLALDEASCPTKARTRGKTYNPSKPDKFAFRFYSLNGWRYVYTYCLWDNGAGNTLPSSPAQRFLSVFTELQCSFNLMCSVVASQIKNCCPIWSMVRPCCGS